MVRRARLAGAAVAAGCAFATPAAAEQPIPTPIGVGPRFHPPATSSTVANRGRVGRFVCGARVRELVRAHVEVFARRRVVIVPAGIGVAPPYLLRNRAIVRARCVYPLRTAEPTGVVEVDARLRPTVGDLFAMWGQRLGARRMLSFAGPVRAYVAGKRWGGDARRIPLRRHAQIVLEVGGYIPPHKRYLFGPGR
jgi:hypothetical protein